MAKKKLSPQELDAYFDRMAEAFGLDALHKEFGQDSLVSEGIKLHLNILSVGQGAPTIVFIPGTAVYTLCYAELLHKLWKAGYNVVAFDPRGNGQSEGRRGDYTIKELMTDTQNVITYAIERFGEDVSLMGSSQGGIVSLYLAGIEPRIKSIICQNFADLTDPGTAQLTRFPWLAKIGKPLIKLGAKLFPHLSFPVIGYLELEKEKIRHFGNAKNFIEQDPLALTAITLRTLNSLAGTPPPVPLEKITTPTFVIQPRLDKIFPVSYTQHIFDRLTCKKQMKIYPHTSHVILFDQVDVVMPDVLAWLKDVHQPELV